MIIEQWQELRDNLLHLHKSLLDYQRAVYEGQHGKIPTPGMLLGLVMEHKDFTWLRQLSELVVGIDEMLESKDPVTEQNYKDTLAYAKKLLSPNKEGNGFEKNYFTAIQQNPRVALEHSKVMASIQKIPA